MIETGSPLAPGASQEIGKVESAMRKIVRSQKGRFECQVLHFHVHSDSVCEGGRQREKGVRERESERPTCICRERGAEERPTSWRMHS